MSTIIIGGYMAQYPLGALMSWTFQYLTGFKSLGHEVYFVEQAHYDDSCFNPILNSMTHDPGYGIEQVNNLLKKADLQHNWCYRDTKGQYFGMDKPTVQAIFNRADLFIDMAGGFGWEEEQKNCQVKIVIDGEPGYWQIQLQNALAQSVPPPVYDHYYTVGLNIGHQTNKAPTAGINWKHINDPVNCDLFQPVPPPLSAPFTTLMNWQSHKSISYDGVEYGQKDVEFTKFIRLPKISSEAFELAISGKNTPFELLAEMGWRLIKAHDVTLSYDIFKEYINNSKAEFCVCKNVFTSLHTGVFSDRSAAFLAAGRPVLMQETGFSDYLPCGKGLFSFSTIEEAVESIERINKDWKFHSKAAREIALEFLHTKTILSKLLHEIEIDKS